MSASFKALRRGANGSGRGSGARNRVHGAVVGPPARRTLERAGWRTTLEYCENHRRSLDGQLLAVEPVWRAEAQRFDNDLALAQACADSAEAAWEALLDQVERGEVEFLRRVRFA